MSPIGWLDMALGSVGRAIRLGIRDSSIAYSVRVSDGGTDSFLGLEYFGLITLTSREFRVHSMRFFRRACFVSAFLWLRQCRNTAATPLLLFALTVYLSWGTFIGFLGLCGIWSCVFGAFALLTLTVPAQVLTVTGRRVAEGGGFLPNSAVFTLVLGLSVLFKEFFALVLVFLGYACGVAFSLRMPLLRLAHPCGGWSWEFLLRSSSLVAPAFVCGSFLEWRNCVFFLSACLARGWLLLSHWLGLASVPLPAAPAVFRGVSCRRLPLWGSATFSGSSCLSCSGGGALSVGFAVSLVRLWVFHLVPYSSSGACGFVQLPLP